jgi:hypothetical protein
MFREMLRAAWPSLIVAIIAMMPAAIAYGGGAPAWVMYAGLVVGMLALVPGADRWAKRDFGDRK